MFADEVKDVMEKLQSAEQRLNIAASDRRGKTLQTALAYRNVREAVTAKQLAESELMFNIPGDCYGPRGGLDKDKFESYLKRNTEGEIIAEKNAQNKYDELRAQENEANNRYMEADAYASVVRSQAQLLAALLGGK